MKKILAVYDSDLFYVTRFMEYFKNKKEFSYELLAFSLQESLEDYLKSHTLEILILGRQISLEEYADKISCRFYLREHSEPESGDEAPSIFKYQPAQKVMDEVLRQYREQQSRQYEENEAGQTSLYVIFSPLPNACKLVFAWCLAYQLAIHKKVLFLPLELFSTSPLSFQKEAGQELSEFIYYLKENEDLALKMKSLITFGNNLDYISGCAHGFDSLTLTKEDMQRWISELKLHTDYQAVIFWLGFYSEAGAEILKLSDKVIIPTEESAYETAILQDFERQMKCIGITPHWDKFKRHLLLQKDSVREEYRTFSELMDSPLWAQARDCLDC